MSTAKKEVEEFHRSLAYFEDSQKVSKGIEKLSDGITHKPVFLIRNVLRQLRCSVGIKQLVSARSK